MDYESLKAAIRASADHPLCVKETEKEVDEKTFKSFAHQLDLLLRQNVNQCVSQSERFRLLEKEKKKRIMELVTQRRKHALQIGKALGGEVTEENCQEILSALSFQFIEDCSKVMQQE